MRRVVTLAVVVLLTAGCNGTTGTPTATTAELDLTATGEPTAFVLFTERVAEPPAGAVVISISNETLDGDRVLKRIVRETAETGGDTRNLHEEIHERLSDQLADLPVYDSEQFGYYVRVDDTIVRVAIGVEE